MSIRQSFYGLINFFAQSAKLAQIVEKFAEKQQEDHETLLLLREEIKSLRNEIHYIRQEQDLKNENTVLKIQNNLRDFEERIKRLKPPEDS